ncbi:MAG TPA: HesA/MoeB/ThiF family protein [Candidatus Nanoarchaeia archaeon]|nr:HesA/MoeB/ThiF family protein [Candidatus Nanoarchaeia archaeon]
MRYSRQELVLGKKGQKKLERARIAIVGLGAVGSVATELAARAGIGSITLFDRDRIELTNLQRQTLYTEKEVGFPKAEVAEKKLREINSEIEIQAMITDINHKNISELLADSDLILDCTDNLYTRFLINDFSRKAGIPWIYAACVSDHGNVMLTAKETPCFRCTFQEVEGLESCDTAGILNTTSHIIAALSVHECIRYLTGSFNEQQLFHLTGMRVSAIHTVKDKRCPACNGNLEYLSGKKEKSIIEYQCSNLYKLFQENIDLPALQKKWKKIGNVKGNDNCLFFKNLSVFKNGRILIKAKNIEDAKSTIAKYIGN